MPRSKPSTRNRNRKRVDDADLPGMLLSREQGLGADVRKSCMTIMKSRRRGHYVVHLPELPDFEVTRAELKELLNAGAADVARALKELASASEVNGNENA